MIRLWKKWLIAGFMMSLLAGITISPVQAETNDVTLTDKQIAEMKTLQQELVEKEKTIINKYVEYGVLTEEKGKNILEHLDRKYKMLEENQFVPKWDHKHHHKKDKE
ncbi:YckD family protein [Gracilibacillus caseinilyticus]|uniref:YckD family protein n=1 Tax=Gracilibacillus caseinilyticus TaxID=2932256 RepID=A0ABY4ETR1_9BACI|nr:YckD family protein [Gracilibacillus caseinilyticus]UOQ47659.1 YckD family protein [Gracilibacillus caseinilyticus]